MLGKEYPEREIITKVLRSLTSKWLSKANAIVEGVHYQSGTLTFDQLRGNLITYEMTILDQNGENNTTRYVNFTDGRTDGQAVGKLLLSTAKLSVILRDRKLRRRLGRR
ncbi:hypothetical protein PIB30_104444 [Stylosanthes scabra]|uniref:Uncharacterized protein n=1 Tax=Stylosanthes scabra TaxID=79078 RepID=A0ABU6RYE3_9FABA|nr:hypothetical protein [Stylosanthes scabra]